MQSWVRCSWWVPAPLETRVPVFQTFLSSIIACVGDMGTEFGLLCVKPVPIDPLLPHVEPPPAGDIAEETDWALFSQEPPTVFLRLGLQVAGVQHVIHNAGRDMFGVCEYLSPHVTGVSAIAKLLRTPATRLCLEQTCFSSATGLAMRSSLAGGRCKVHIPWWSS